MAGNKLQKTRLASQLAQTGEFLLKIVTSLSLTDYKSLNIQVEK